MKETEVNAPNLSCRAERRAPSKERPAPSGFPLVLDIGTLRILYSFRVYFQ